MTTEEHDLAVLSAERTLSMINEQIAAAKQEHAETAPAAAVQAGLSLAEAGSRHAAAERHVGFLMDAAEAATTQLRKAQVERDAARAEATWRPKFQVAVAKRLEAIRSWESAKRTLAQAEADYEVATKAIEEAISYGVPRPPHLRENPLRLAWTIDHSTKVQMPPAASEAALWEKYL